MYRKYLLPVLTSLFISGQASAQITETETVGILPLMSQLLGMQVRDPYVILGLAATFGIVSIVNYIILKKAFMKLDMLDVVNIGGGASSGGRNILAILAPLITISIIGTGFFFRIIRGFQGLMALMLLFILIGGFLALIGSGLFLTASGVGYAGGKAKNTFDDVFERDEDRLAQVGDTIEEVRREEEDARERGNRGDRSTEHDEEEDAERKINVVLNALDSVEGDFQELLEENKEEIDEAIKKVKEAQSDADAEEEISEDMIKRLNRVNDYLDNANDSIPDDFLKIHPPKLMKGEDSYNFVESGRAPGGYGLNRVEKDLKTVEDRLNQLNANISDEEGFLGDSLKRLVEAAEEVVKLHKASLRVKDELDETEDLTEFAEKLAKKEKFKELYEEAEEEEKKVEKAEQVLNTLEEEEITLYEKLDNADDLLKKHLELSHKARLVLDGKAGPKTFGQPSSIENGLRKLAGNLRGQEVMDDVDYGLDVPIEKLGGTDQRSLIGIASSIKEAYQEIDSELDSEYDTEQRAIQRLEEHLDQFS